MYISLLLLAMVSQGKVPPPPKSELEIFVPNTRSERSAVKCAAHSGVISWHFDGKVSAVDSLEYDKLAADKKNLEKINSILARDSADVSILLECNNEGENIHIVEARKIPNSAAKSASFTYIGGGLEEIRSSF